MLGTLDKHRVKEIEDDDDIWDGIFKAQKLIANAKKGKGTIDSSLFKKPILPFKALNKQGKTRFIEQFLMSKMGQAQTKKEDLELEEQECHQNPNKYNIFEEKLNTESEGFSTSRGVFPNSPNKQEDELNNKNTISLNENDPSEVQNEGGEELDDYPINDMEGTVNRGDLAANNNEKISETDKKVSPNDEQIDYDDVKYSKSNKNTATAKPIDGKYDSYSNLLGYNTSKLQPKASLYDDY